MAGAKKKKKFLRLVLLLLVVAALVGVYFLIGGEDETIEENPNSSVQREDLSVALCNFATEDIVKVSFENPKFAATVVKQTDGSYVMEEEPEFPLNQTRATYLFANITAKAERMIAENAELSVYGLDKPSIRIVATDKSGAQFRLNIGDKIGTVSENGYYACIEGEDTVYVVSAALNVYYNLDKAAWIRQENLPTIDTTTIVGVEIESAEFSDLALFHTGAVGDGDGNPNTGNWRMEKPYPNVLSLSEANVTTQIANYSGFSFGNPVDYKKENFASYGLEEPVTRLTLTYEVSSDLTTDMLKKKIVLNIGNQNENGDYYVNLAGSPLVYLMTGANVRGLVAPDVESLVEKRFSLIYIYTISELEVTYGDTRHLYEMTHEDVTDESGTSTTKKSSFVVDGVKVSDESTSFNTFYTNFVKPTASWILPEDTKAEGEPVITLRYKRTDPAYGDLLMEYFPYDDSFYALRINGVMMYAVDKRDIATMIDGINAYVPD